MRQNEREIIWYQNDYIHWTEYIDISNDQKLQKIDFLTYSVEDDFRTLNGQLGWVSGRTRQDLAFKTCQLSATVNHGIVDDLI